MSTQKVFYITIDGVRAEAFRDCGHPLVEEIYQKASYTLDGVSVIPPVTLPAHLSIFQSVPPTRHGVYTNTYVPPSRPLEDLFEAISNAKKSSAMFYAWEPIREVCRAGFQTYSEFAWAYSMESSDTYLTERALNCVREHEPDFIFLHLVETDEKGGHDHGWMTKEYFDRLAIALDNVKKIIDTCQDKYTIIVSADHGGHERIHGMDMPEDMIIPMFFLGERFEAGKELHNISLLDLAPTIATLMGLPMPREWEGKSVI